MDDANKNFILLKHPNGSATLVDEENGQAMHSRIGPTLEAGLVYAERARVEDSLNSRESSSVLYDVGMGTGANVTATLDRVLASRSAWGTLSIFSFEKKPDGLRATLSHLDSFPEIRPWSARLETLLEVGRTEFRVGKVDVHWRLLAGDFFDRLGDAPPPDTIYFDFYAPKVVPDLWSFGSFLRLRGKIGDHPARLFTYSSATLVRLNLFAAGFFVGAGASTDAKWETTVAATRYALLERPLPRSWLAKLERADSIQGPALAEVRNRVAAHPHWLEAPE